MEMMESSVVAVCHCYALQKYRVLVELMPDLHDKCGFYTVLQHDKLHLSC